MKLWLLRPVNEALEPWMPWYDRMFGFVVRASDEPRARLLASSKAGDEGPEAWLSPAHSTCVELRPDGQEAIVMEDYNSAPAGSPPPETGRPHFTGRLAGAGGRSG
jgi:hypothetical protein